MLKVKCEAPRVPRRKVYIVERAPSNHTISDGAPTYFDAPGGNFVSTHARSVRQLEVDETVRMSCNLRCSCLLDNANRSIVDRVSSND